MVAAHGALDGGPFSSPHVAKRSAAAGIHQNFPAAKPLFLFHLTLAQFRSPTPPPAIPGIGGKYSMQDSNHAAAVDRFPGRLAANRANALKSTGPRTPEGKASSSQNARKHGFTAANYAVVHLEDVQDSPTSTTTPSLSTSPSTPRSISPSSALLSPNLLSSALPAWRPACSPAS